MQIAYTIVGRSEAFQHGYGSIIFPTAACNSLTYEPGQTFRELQISNLVRRQGTFAAYLVIEIIYLIVHILHLSLKIPYFSLRSLFFILHSIGLQHKVIYLGIQSLYLFFHARLLGYQLLCACCKIEITYFLKLGLGFVQIFLGHSDIVLIHIVQSHRVGIVGEFEVRNIALSRNKFILGNVKLALDILNLCDIFVQLLLFCVGKAMLCSLYVPESFLIISLSLGKPRLQLKKIQFMLLD